MLKGAIAVVALAVAYWIVVGRMQRSDREIASLRQTVEQMSMKTTRTDRPVVQTVFVETNRVANDSDTPTPSPPSSPAAQATAIPSPAPSFTYEDLQAYWQIAFSRQGSDISWSRQSTSVLREAFGKLVGEGTNLASVDCRSTLCRVELAHGTEDDRRDFMGKMMRPAEGPFWTGEMTAGAVASSGGTVSTVFFLSREGTRLPAPE
jgi:hypothetical protein